MKIPSFSRNRRVSREGPQTIIESEGLPVISGDLWTLHGDGVCQALWFRRVKAEKTLAEIEPTNAVTACQYFWTNEEFTPFNWT